MNQFTMPAFFDSHRHLRQLGATKPYIPRDAIVREAAEYCGRAIGIGNTKPEWVEDPDAAELYEIHASEVSMTMTLHMAMMLSPRTTAMMLREAKTRGIMVVKVMLCKTSTHSSQGAKDIWELRHLLHAAQRLDIVVIIHGEEPGADDADAETKFLPTFKLVHQEFPNLRLSLGHLSTAAAVECVESMPPHVFGELTVHHLFLTYADIFRVNGVIHNPYDYCKPVPKQPEDRERLVEAALTSKKLGFGSDDAKHHYKLKLVNEPIPGCNSSPALPSSTIELFRACGGSEWLDKLVGYTSGRMCRNYRVPMSDRTVTFIEEPWVVPDVYVDRDGEMVGYSGEVATRILSGGPVEEGEDPPDFAVVPWRRGRTMQWQIQP
jgi:dihydroorotase